jgi:hypothetical protein
MGGSGVVPELERCGSSARLMSRIGMGSDDFFGFPTYLPATGRPNQKGACLARATHLIFPHSPSTFSFIRSLAFSFTVSSISLPFSFQTPDLDLRDLRRAQVTILRPRDSLLRRCLWDGANPFVAARLQYAGRSLPPKAERAWENRLGGPF